MCWSGHTSGRSFLDIGLVVFVSCQWRKKDEVDLHLPNEHLQTCFRLEPVWSLNIVPTNGFTDGIATVCLRPVMNILLIHFQSSKTLVIVPLRPVFNILFITETSIQYFIDSLLFIQRSGHCSTEISIQYFIDHWDHWSVFSILLIHF